MRARTFGLVLAGGALAAVASVALGVGVVAQRMALAHRGRWSR